MFTFLILRGDLINLLVSKFITIKWTKKSRKYYEKLGYIFTNFGDNLTVFINHLQKTNNVKIKVQCDYCGKIFYKNFHTYNNSKKLIINKDCCFSCAGLKKEEIYLININNNSVTKYNMKHSYEYVKNQFDIRGFELLEKEYKNIHTKMRCRCKKHPHHVREIEFKYLMKNGLRCKYCYESKKRKVTNKDKIKHDWYEGLVGIKRYLRHTLKKWRDDSKNYYNNKCIVTGKKSDVIHHLYSLGFLVVKTLHELNLPLKQTVYHYTKDELELIKTKCLELHYIYGLGICLCNKVHKLFHRYYKFDNTPKQFEEFCQRFYANEFKY